MYLLCIFCCISVALAGTSNDVKENYKDQYCTDPRTMRKHAAYTEWADAYSCSRHRCQPGGRNLAIYTVGCKRVEAPESAIECEEVVEDTNMQFPFCCTRLRCLVVVRGEVWTRVLGQPWETLPAAPWSHMYKMKKPPPTDTTFLPKIGDQGPVYELTEPESDGARDKVLRAGKKTVPADNNEGNEMMSRAVPPPDIVIALSTNSEQQKDHITKEINTRQKRKRKTSNHPVFEEERHETDTNDVEEPAISMSTEKPAELSEERFYANAYGVTQKPAFKSQLHEVTWTEIPQNQWNEHDPNTDQETRDTPYQQVEPTAPESEKKEKERKKERTNLYLTKNSLESDRENKLKEEKPANLQALVDAIGTRMRDIEHVVQRMSEKVHHAKPVEYASTEKRTAIEPDQSLHKHHKSDKEAKASGKTKRPNPDGDHYKRFSVRNRGGKYLHGTTDVSTDQPLYAEDTNMNGYFSDASNSVLRRSNAPKEPAALQPTYMAPVENHRKSAAHIAVVSDLSEDEKKHKKRGHKKRKAKKGKGHKKRTGKEEKKKHYGRSSLEIDKNFVSLEDSSAVVNK